MKVHVGSVLYDYTGGASELSAKGRTVAAVLDDLERRHPGIRFRVVDEQERIRPHMRLFLDETPVRDLEQATGSARVLHVLGALSGG